MKKLLNFVLVGILSIGMLVGCASEVDTGNSSTEVPSGESKKQEAPKEEDKPVYPTKEIEFVVPSSAGGGSDLNARTIADLAQKNNFSPESFMVVNKPGGSGAVSYSYVYGKKGDPNTMMVLHSGQIMSAIVNDSPVKADMLTYLGVLAKDELILAVHKDAKYKDVESLVKAAVDNPESVKVGGSQRGNGDHLAYELLNKYTEGQYTYVQFNSSGETMSALLGGHVDAGIFNPLECLGQIEAGEVIPVAVYADGRLKGAFTDTPTFEELGYPEIQLSEVRAIAGPPNMPKEAVEFYEDMLKKVTETEEWQKNYIEKNFMTSAYMNAEDTKEFFEGQIKVYTEIFKEVGLIK